ncbi:hypothetical protein [Pseudonocardia acaciae]|uniref:hypothetical protein n=1 Tax=Pseudonocardia acaciae TaxID=551276 RepID=UPI00048EAFF7|nr:hypothetical protein [Pseudonocardia acaciae]
MLTRLTRPLAALVTALLIGGCGAARIPSDAADPAATSKESRYQIDQPVTRVVLAGRVGDVTVYAAPGPVTVLERMTYADTEPATSHDLAGGVLTLSELGCPNQPADTRCRVDYTINAPPGTALELGSRSGNLMVAGMAGELIARSTAGKVASRDLTSGSVLANSGAGDIELDFAQPPTQVVAISNAGAVRLAVPKNTGYSIQANTPIGAPRLEVPLDMTSTHRIQAESTGDTVEVTVH